MAHSPHHRVHVHHPYTTPPTGNTLFAWTDLSKIYQIILNIVKGQPRMSQFETPPLPPSGMAPSAPLPKPTPSEAAKAQQRPQASPSQEHVTLTEEADEIQRLIQTIKALPDVRQERINHIQTALQSGTYHIDSRELADKIIKDLLETHSSR